MPHFICTTCGTQYAESPTPPGGCTICLDERQYVKPSGQQWTTLEQLRRTHRLAVRHEEPGLIGIGIEPHFSIGQRALLIRTPQGNVLWDCVSLVDPSIVEMLQALGGLAAIAISHPHYYTSMVEWSRAFGGVPIYLHADDQEWVQRPDAAIVAWQGETLSLGEGLTLIRCGGHFAGGTVLHWQAAANGQGVLLTGDILQVVADRQHVSFMYSYPNFIPLSVASVDHIVQAVAPFRYDRIYGAFWDMVIDHDATAIVERSAARYRKAIAER